MKRILFVGLAPAMQRIVTQAFSGMSREWSAIFKDGFEAGEVMTRAEINVVVVAVNYPDLQGINTLTWFHKNFPQVVKVAITDQKNVIDHLRSAGIAQQFICKSFDQETLNYSLRRSLALGDLLHHGILQRIISQVRTLPSLPSLYLQIADELNRPDPTAERVGHIIAQDISMTAKVLQIVNSAHFGLPYQIVNPTQATVMLGLETIRDLVLSIQVFSNFDHLKLRHLGLTRLWDHSTMTGVCAKKIARSITRDKAIQDYSFVSGMLHDIGKLILADNLPMKYHTALELASTRRVEAYQAEMDVFGTTHAEVGAYLLWLWNLPEPVLTATAYHHNPHEHPVQGFSPVTMVHMANVFSHQFGSSNGKIALPQLNLGSLQKAGVAEQVDGLLVECEMSLRTTQLQES